VVLEALADRLGANPIEALLNRMGFWTLTFLMASLACTPLKLFLKITWPLRIRRMVGLFAFFYGVLHFGTYLGLDQAFDWGAVGEDIATRPFIAVGFAALVILAPLAATSTDAMVRRLGFVRWKRLHRLAYLAAVLGVIHFVWRVKADLREPLLFAAVLAVLMVARVVGALRERGRRA
jgi:sulfoxide reductase heme-binding subunit YedZ